jgi:hypothetical protein
VDIGNPVGDIRHSYMNMKMDTDMEMDTYMDRHVDADMGIQICGCRIQLQVLSYILHYVGFRLHQSDIGGSNIRLIPIFFITDIGLSAPLKVPKHEIFDFIFFCFKRIHLPPDT